MSCPSDHDRRGEFLLSESIFDLDFLSADMVCCLTGNRP